MAKLRRQLGKSKLAGGRGQPSREQLKRKEVRAAYRAVAEAAYRHRFRLMQAEAGHATNIMETRRILLDAEKRYRILTGEDYP